MALAFARSAKAPVQSQQSTGSGLGAKSSQAVVALEGRNMGRIPPKPSLDGAPGKPVRTHAG